MLLKRVVLFFVIALVTAAFGFTGIPEGATEIAKVLFYIFLALFVVVLVAGLIGLDTNLRVPGVFRLQQTPPKSASC